jgi:hypothetical protein
LALSPICFALFRWIIQYSGSLIDFFGRSDDGKTPWQRRTGRLSREQLPEFGEVAMVKLAARQKVSQRWAKASFLGVKIRSRENIGWMTDPSYEDVRRGCVA